MFWLNLYEQQGYINALLKCLGSVKFLKKWMIDLENMHYIDQKRR